MLTHIIVIAFFAAVLSAGPVATAPVKNGTTPPVVWLNGHQVDLVGPQAVGNPCSGLDDVLACAQAYAKQWIVAPNATTPEMTLNVPVILGRGTPQENPGYLVANFSVEYTECQLSDPIIVDEQEGIFCPNDAIQCIENLSFATATTTTMNYGFQVGGSFTAGFDIGVASASLTVSSNYDQNWSSSTTNTTMTSRQWTMAPGTVCFPTTIQFGISCHAQVKPIFGLGDQGDTYTVVNENGADFNFSAGVVCGSEDTVSGPAKDDYCSAVSNGNSIKVDLNNHSGQTWELQGCLSQQ